MALWHFLISKRITVGSQVTKPFVEQSREIKTVRVVTLLCVKTQKALSTFWKNEWKLDLTLFAYLHLGRVRV